MSDPVINKCTNYMTEKILATRPHIPPPSFFPLERIHYVYSPDPPYHAVFCTACHHYTVFRARDSEN